MSCVVCGFQKGFLVGYETHPDLPREQVEFETLQKLGEAFAAGMSFARLCSAESPPIEVVSGMCVEHRGIYEMPTGAPA